MVSVAAPVLVVPPWAVHGRAPIGSGIVRADEAFRVQVYIDGDRLCIRSRACPELSVDVSLTGFSSVRAFERHRGVTRLPVSGSLPRGAMFSTTPRVHRDSAAVAELRGALLCVWGLGGEFWTEVQMRPAITLAQPLR